MSRSRTPSPLKGLPPKSASNQSHVSGIPRYQAKAGSQEQASSQCSSQIVPEVRVHPKYIDYILDKENKLRQKGEPGSYRFPSFDQLDKKRAPIPLDPSYSDQVDKYGIHPFAGQNVIKDFDEKFPEEKDLPKDARGDRNVYGEHPITGLPLYGPAEWHHFYKEWHEVGPKLLESLPIDSAVPLNQDELTFCRNAFGIEFIRRLGSGNFGAVWKVVRTWKEEDNYGKGRMRRRQEAYACKICNLKRMLELMGNTSLKEVVDFVINEANITHADDFNHPNVLKTEHIFHIHEETTGFPSITILILMEVCDGDLNSMLGYLYWSKTLSEDETRPIMLDICHGLKYLHDKRIAHLDIKPANILFKVDPNTGKRVYKLSDFGLAEKFESEDTMFDRSPGTTNYMAPELLKPFKTDALKADIYSLGKCLIQMLIGRWYMVWTKPELWPPDHDNYPPDWETDLVVLQRWCQNYGISLAVGDLYRRMTQLDYKRRPTIEQVIADPWFTMDNS